MALGIGGAMYAEAETSMRTIFKLCVQCPDQTPTCPNCPNGQICSLVPQTCAQCSHMTCLANPNPAPTSASPNVGAIAGGVVGGIFVVVIAMFFLWRFWIKKRRQQQEMEAEEWEEDEIAQQKGGTRRFTAMRSDAASTRSRQSIANTILSRASNIIQIAYIPGVTNRSGSNSALNTPVPPIPAQYAQSPRSPLSNEGDALFFRPGSLRGSTYSDGMSIRSSNRDTQYTRQSITPSLARSSVMSDVYMDDATSEPMPATQLYRLAPRMVSVRPNLSPVPSPGSAPGNIKIMIPGQSGSGSSVPGPTNTNTNSFAKATQVTVGKSKGRLSVTRQTSDSSSASGTSGTSTRHMPAVSSPLIETATDSEDEDEHARARRSLINATARAADPSPLVTSQPITAPSAQPMESPFFDASDLLSNTTAGNATKPNPYAAMSASVRTGGPRRDRGPGGLSAVIEETTKRGSQDTSSEIVEVKNDIGPFSDAHRTE